MSKMKRLQEERKEIVQEINRYLEMNWADDEVLAGKTIDVHPMWRTHLSYLLPKYKDAGWVIKRNVEISSAHPHSRREYLSFTNPLWNPPARVTFR